MKVKKNVHQLAKRFVKASTKDGFVDETRVHAVVSAILRSRTADTIAVLKAYKRGLERYIKEHTAIVEVAASLTKEQEEGLRRKIIDRFTTVTSVQFIIMPELIGGIRVTINDTIYDESITGKFAQMKESL